MIRSRELDFGTGEERGLRQTEFERQCAGAQEYMDSKVREREEETAHARAIVEVEMPDIKKILEQIDFKVLHEILGEYMGRSGVDPASFNFLEKSDIQSVNGDNLGGAGFYEPLINKIFVNLNFFQSEPDDLRMPLIIIHELVHAASGFLYRSHGSAAKDIVRLGYAENKGIKPGVHPQYSAFDEAVTEKIAREVMETYAKRTGITPQLQKLKVLMSEEKKFGDYSPQVEFLESMIRKMSLACEVPEDIVWGAIKKGKFASSELGDPEVEQALIEIFNAKFVNRLKQGNNEYMVESKILGIMKKLVKIFKIN